MNLTWSGLVTQQLYRITNQVPEKPNDATTLDPDH
jgi:hypothetical protein